MMNRVLGNVAQKYFTFIHVSCFTRDNDKVIEGNKVNITMRNVVALEGIKWSKNVINVMNLSPFLHLIFLENDKHNSVSQNTMVHLFWTTWVHKGSLFHQGGPLQRSFHALSRRMGSYMQTINIDNYMPHSALDTFRQIYFFISTLLYFISFIIAHC